MFCSKKPMIVMILLDIILILTISFSERETWWRPTLHFLGLA